MADTYGREVKAQKGQKVDYTFQERPAEEFLTDPVQRSAYERGLAEYNAAMPSGLSFKAQKKEIDRREQIYDQVRRLRDLAGVNALGEFESFASSLGRSTKASAPAGFLSERRIGVESPLPTLGGAEKDKSRAEFLKRYQDIQGKAVDDRPFMGISAAGVTEDERVKLRDRFRNMRLGIDVPERTSGSPMISPYLEHPFATRLSEGKTDKFTMAKEVDWEKVMRERPEDIYAGTWTQPSMQKAARGF